ncbi:glycoside hydrolase family 3 C-terminal domain-containing protein [Tunturiibacter gelidoferens]|uniref:Beta-glucosidase n=1 Tax=Tunturiibacter lichenicola TaxID=2051959 RepID=A0A7Y9T2P7_9BACT|nr:glycoside hydrolase family 3 C-terminal domain-containing protein [Edaphobacter lichenicola]NYF51943.1 beta-glucosidase [Edaphobacter lichenicola]
MEPITKRVGLLNVFGETRSMWLRLVSAFFLVLSLMPFGSFAQSSKQLPYLDSYLSNDERVNDLVSRMTLDEKVAQLINTAPAIPRLNLPAYDYWSEGLHGVARSGYATLFPQAIGMAATWDAPLIHQISTAISIEARAKYNEAVRLNIHSIYYGLTIWSPNINIFRDPRWGRGQETYGEDPFLTGRLGVAFVEGLQGDNPDYLRAIATPKHYAVHSGPESTRHSANVDPSPHDLWDTYLPAFRATITEAKAASIMCAYNSINDYPACANKYLLQSILRDDWSFKGFVTSDCGAIDDFYEMTAHHTSPSKEAAAVAGIEAGTDTNCGDTYLALTEALKKHLISELQIDVSLKRLLLARYRLGLFDDAFKVPYAAIPFSEVNSPSHKEVAKTAARESMVLLKNDSSFLPLNLNTRTIAVVGPNAASLAAIEGNYNAIAEDAKLPVDAIAAEFRNSRILYAQGSPYADQVPLPIPRTVFHPSKSATENGLKGEYFSGGTFEGKPVTTRIDKAIDFDWNSASPTPGVPSNSFAVRWTGTITAPQTGDLALTMHFGDCYPCTGHEQFKIFVDGELIASDSLSGSDSNSDSHFRLNFVDTDPHDFKVEYIHHAPLRGADLSLEWTPQSSYLRKEAVAIAQKSEVIVAFVGLSPNLEGEEMPLHVEGFSGGDRTDIKLPAAQQELLEALTATGKPLVVVLMNGSALSVNWAHEHAKAILEAWYPGEAGSEAIAETLSGQNNPGGRLPVTFYAGVEQLPAFDDYSMANRTYRYFKSKPLYGFGYGLSYTTFSYQNLRLSSSNLKAGDSLTAEADVKNTGIREGDEVAELYLISPHSSVSPNLALAGFTRLHLKPGETMHVTFTLDCRILSQVDDKGNRAVVPGSYVVAVGGAQPADSRLVKTAAFSVQNTLILPP